MMSGSMMRVTVLATVMGAGLFFVGCGEEPRNKTSATASEVIDDPLWYRSLDTNGKILAVQKRLDLMTSTSVPAHRAGPIKDEIALLCTDEAVVDRVVESFRRRQDLSVAQISAYMEIFGRIRHPEFGSLLTDGILMDRMETQINALEAAIVQRSPELVPYLGTVLKTHDGYVGLKIISALIGINTAASRRFICEAVSSEDAGIANEALSAVGGLRLTDALPRAMKRIGDGPDIVRVMASWAVARMGQSSGSRSLVKLAADKSVEKMARAQALQNLTLLRYWSAADELRPLLTSEVAEVRLETAVFLATAGDKKTREHLIQVLDNEDAADRDQALRVLARTGHPEDLELVQSKLGGLHPREILVFSRSLMIVRPAGSLEFISNLLRKRPDMRPSLIGLMGPFGEKGLLVLEELMDANQGVDRAWTLQLIGAIGGVQSKRAQEVLATLESTSDRRVWRFARENIRLIEQRMLKVEPVPYMRPSGSGTVNKR